MEMNTDNITVLLNISQSLYHVTHHYWHVTRQMLHFLLVNWCISGVHEVERLITLLDLESTAVIEIQTSKNNRCKNNTDYG